MINDMIPPQTESLPSNRIFALADKDRVYQNYISLPDQLCHRLPLSPIGGMISPRRYEEQGTIQVFLWNELEQDF